MSNVELKLNEAELVKLYRQPGGRVWFIINRYGERVAQKAQQLAPVDQGGLRGSIKSETRSEGGNPVAYVGSNLKYAVYVHEGTGIYSKTNPRMITPKSGKALRWPAKNNSGSGNRRYRGGSTSAYVYSKSSKGSPGRPFLLNALKAVIPTKVV